MVGGPRILMISGVGAGVGKSTITRALARALDNRGNKVVGIKPVEPWCGRNRPGCEDGESLAPANTLTARSVEPRVEKARS